MIKTNLLTHLTFELNALLDKGLSVPLKETVQYCKEKTIFGELERRFTSEGLDLSLLNPEVRKELGDIFEDMAKAKPASEYEVANNGLCLLIAYTQQQIQRQTKSKP